MHIGFSGRSAGLYRLRLLFVYYIHACAWLWHCCSLYPFPIRRACFLPSGSSTEEAARPCPVYLSVSAPFALLAQPRPFFFFVLRPLSIPHCRLVMLSVRPACHVSFLRCFSSALDLL
ncbi:hypothetical protein BDY21DRAFT_355300, partial [Lineolata rhizophorae]